jgi:SAM-dependent methyltransferase
VPEAKNLDEDAKASLVRAGYDGIAEDYLRLVSDAPDAHPRRARTGALLNALPVRASVLEVGCGAGVPVGAEFIRNGHSYIGVDVSPRQVELATTHLPHGDFRLGDILDQTFEAEVFDAVVALYVITHVPREKWSTLIHNIREWLKVGGVLLVNVPHGDSPGWLEENFLGFGGTNWTNAYGAETTAGILEAEGLTVVEAVALGDDDTSPNGWVWITATKGS